MPLPMTKGPTLGKCNICALTNQKLTSDHVPPKGTIKFPRMKLHSIIDFLEAKDGMPQKGREFQQGVKFRTICESCNSNIIGSQYDPALIKLCNDISDYLQSQIVRPTVMSFRAQPDLVARAIAGHILSIGVEHFPRGEMGDALAEFVLNPNSSPPNGLAIHYWLYPYWEQVSIRGAGLLVRFGTPPLVISLIKFTPIAFMITWDADPGFDFPYPNLVDHIPSTPREFADIPLDFRIVPPARYPEAPGGEGVVLHGTESYVATRTKPKNNRQSNLRDLK
ncbi:MAG: hypothetical protein EOO53_14005 [Gammaproteobacteria bacterium]|nr:MAG: hypothetical protein EOO53_14005 [Gammaproteobacteria bacterium]